MQRVLWHATQRSNAHIVATFRLNATTGRKQNRANGLEYAARVIHQVGRHVQVKLMMGALDMPKQIVHNGGTRSQSCGVMRDSVETVAI